MRRYSSLSIAILKPRPARTLAAVLIAIVCANALGFEHTTHRSTAACTDGGASNIAELGLRVFTDVRLSATRKVSCASCHIPRLAFSDGLNVAMGDNAQRGTRNTPSLWNASDLPSVFWDGRRTTLEAQALDPLLNAREHGLTSEEELLTIVRSDPTYTKAFRDSFGPTAERIESCHVIAVLAAFQRTLRLEPSPFDRFRHEGRRSALSDAQFRGLELFEGRAGCAKCHIIDMPNAPLSDYEFHSIGVGLDEILPRLATLTQQVAAADRRTLDRLIAKDADIAALGRFVVTKDPRDIGKFRTPSLRNVALTAPYMHDGRIGTLEAAIDFEVYYRSLQATTPLILTPSEKQDIVAFLHALTSPNATKFPKM